MLHFITDPHLGQSLLSHTTLSSRKALRQALYDQICSVMNSVSKAMPWVIGGDLFHSYSNDETTIKQGMTIANKSSLCLAGNHDVSNRSDVIGSLELLSGNNNIKIVPVGESNYFNSQLGNCWVTAVPHHSSQELFDNILVEIVNEGVTIGEGQTKVLLLHCNYESPWETNDTTLNLTESQAKILLKLYDYILIGHEHNSRVELGGKVIIMGNPHPTSFHDISDKFFWTLDEGVITPTKIWDKKTGYRALNAFEEFQITEEEFLEVKGEITPEEYPKYTKWLSNLWKNCPDVYAIKNSVTVKKVKVTQTIDAEGLESLPTTIRKELEDSPLLSVFNDLSETLGYHK